jgi:hypothetical protein
MFIDQPSPHYYEASSINIFQPVLFVAFSPTLPELRLALTRPPMLSFHSINVAPELTL